MKLKYKCTNGACRKSGEREKRLSIPAEIAMDDKNIAVMFCPKCKRELKRTQ